ncbi:palmitoleoyl-protein carboxylesterase NOTUM isoform X2 [Folsomia candida]|uniref:palmitoleoyl-protein carboxylesterase NOTUM isoform X2 n=1 Tax=Folsomia candida TaxID=158441 RepID=UPI00160526B1|nr:palmitoleoyl-protein carboxylesterase NOTUM isoform X2 [Folsomia candida]
MEKEQTYYVRNSHVRNSNTWIIFLEGGWFCFDERSCQNRWLRLKNLMSSSAWPHHKHVGGILSGDPNENPYWWSANHVFVPYCSSDTWSGTTKADENGSKFSFMGALIIEEVIKTLIRNGGIRSDSTVILAGSSAGGTGVLINLDRVEELMHEQFDYVDSGPPRVKGISDSGWFIDKLPSYSEKVDCHDVILCPPHISLKKGMHLWNSRLPERCQNSYPDEPWSCFFGYRIYPTLKASSFIFQWMFDEAQMLVNNVPTPVLKKEEWDYVYKVGDELKKTLINVTNVFIPACMAHTVLTHRDWKRVEVNSVYLPRALKCWESGGIVGESNSIQSSHASYQSGWDDDDEEESSSLSHRRNPRLGNRISLQHSTPTEQSDFLDVNSNDSRRNRRRHNRHRQAQMTKRERRKHRKKMEQERIAAEKASQANNNKRRNVANDFHVANSDTLSTKTRLRQRRRHQDNKPTTNSQQQSDEPLRGRSVNNNNHINSRTNSNTKSSNNSNNNGRVPRKNNNNSNNHHHRSSNSNSLDVTNNFTNNHLRNNNRNNNNKKKNRKRRWYSVCDAGDSSVGGAGGDIRLIENRCSFPQCNKSCPKLLNPLTGEEVDFKDLLKSFGLDMATMAKALGIDLATLNNMDHQVLLQMLTQHA